MSSISMGLLVVLTRIFVLIASISCGRIFVQSATNNFPAVELQALKDLYQSTNGPHWSWKNNTGIFGVRWNFTEKSPNPCGDHWQGIYCTSSCTGKLACNVEEIILPSYNLVGTLPSTIGNFSKLTYLDLATNSLEGSIPHQIATLKSIQTLLLNTNKLNGLFPYSITSLPKLETFDIYNNMIYGTLPNDLSKLSSLQIFVVCENALNGTVPQSLYSLTTLTNLQLCINKFEGTISSDIKRLSKLQTLYLNSNQLVGSIPSEIGSLVELVDLQLNDNYFTRTIPESLNNLNKLQKLYLDDNELEGSLPRNMSGLASLQDLVLHGNQLTGPLPYSLTKLKKLQLIHVCYNQLTGTIPQNISALSQLQELILCSNKLNGTLPTALSRLSRLRMLMVNDNQLTGSIPPTFDHLKQLSFLYLYSNRLVGTVPCELGNLSHLTVFDLYNNQFTGTLCPHLGKLQNVTLFSVSNNQMHGKYPLEFNGLRSVKQLLLSNNHFTGSIPISYLQLPNLFEIDFNNNKLTGTIPEEISTLTKSCQRMYLQENRLHGTIPPSFANLTNLVYLDLYDNLLTGTIPEELGQMTSLSTFMIYGNGFHGTLPLSLSNLHNLETFAIYSNEFSGNIMQNVLCNWKKINIIDAFMNQLTGSIMKNCLLINLEYVFIQNNFLTGELVTIASWPNIYTLNFSSNYMFGSIAKSTICPLKNLFIFDVSNNMLTGTLNNIFRNTSTLSMLIVKSNFLNGNLENVLSNDWQSNITVIDVSDNAFTGSLPISFFQGNQYLLSFAAVKNCLTGSIPKEICTIDSLQTLALDGLYTAEECQSRFFPGLSSRTSYQLIASIPGGLPPCLFAMKSMETLHLSGNGIAGTIPSTMVISPQLSEISLSYNQFTGSIPSIIQEKDWKLLDLSFNKLNGILESSFSSLTGTNGTLTLTENRLSGTIPSALLDALDINILKGNLFDCKRKKVEGGDGQDIPENDAHAATYTCGTENVNDSLYLWLMLVGVILCLIIIVCWSGRKGKETNEMPISSGVFAVAIESGKAKEGDIEDKQVEEVSNQQNTRENVEGKVESENEWSRTWNEWCEEYYEDLIECWRMLIAEEQEGNEVFETNPVNLVCGELEVTEKRKAKEVVDQNESHQKDQTRMGSENKKDNGEPAFRLEKRAFVYILSENLHTFRRLSTWFTGLAVLILLPLYSILSSIYSTHSYSYAWTVSVGYLSGLVPSLCIFVVMVFFYIFFTLKSNQDITRLQSISLQHQNYPEASASSPSFATTSAEDGRKLTEILSENEREVTAQKTIGMLFTSTLRKGWCGMHWHHFCLGTAMIAINIVVVMTVNIVYVYCTTLGYSTIIMTLLAICVSVFKLLWMHVVILGVFAKYLRQYDLNNQLPSSSMRDYSQQQNQKEQNDRKQRVFFFAHMVIFNGIIAPFLADAFIDPNCFYYVFQTPSPVSVNYNLIECVVFTISFHSSVCTETYVNVRSAVYTPPFVYSYQCASSLLNGFVPVFVYRYILSGLLGPMMIVLKHYLDNRMSMQLVGWQKADSPSAGAIEMHDMTANPLRTGSKQENDKVPTDDAVEKAPSSSPMMMKVHKLFPSETYIITVVGDLAVLITFGWAFPPLAIVVCFSILTNSLTQQYYVKRAFPPPNPSQQVATKRKSTMIGVRSEDGDLMNYFQPLTPSLALLSSAFIAFFLFDMLGDAVGLMGALWMLITTATMPVWIRLLQVSGKFLWYRYAILYIRGVREQLK